jgi:predicted DNA-binding WGR domain protein
MNSLIKEIEYAIKNAVEEYVQCISSKYEEIDIEDLEEIWNDVSKSMKLSVTMKSSGKVKSTTTAKPNGCPYKFIKGAKQDTICGSNAKDGNVYCSRHKKYEGTEVKEKKSSPDPKRSTVKPKSKSRSPVKSTQRVLRKNKNIDKLWHPETCLVFKSAKERTVVGKCVNDKLIDLTEKDIDECRKWGFSFLPIDDDESSEDDSSSEEEKERFIYMEAPSSCASGKKFWECKISGDNYITRYGKVGKDGSTKEKSFESFDIASTEMDKMINSKSKKGYENKTSKKVETIKEIAKDKKTSKSTSKSFSTPSDIEDALNELQGTSSDQSDEEEKVIQNALGLGEKSYVAPQEEDDDEEDEEEDDEEEKDILGKNFIPNALGLRIKSDVAPLEDDDDDEEEEEMLIEEFDEDEDEDEDE